MYTLGLDLGPTTITAAVCRDGIAAITELGVRSAGVPSVVVLTENGTYLVGDAASGRAAAEPARAARDIVGQIGDPKPLFLAGAPVPAEMLLSRLLAWAVGEVSRREGGQPARLCLAHPAGWGPYHRDRLRQAIRMAEIEAPVDCMPAPEAAAADPRQLPASVGSIPAPQAAQAAARGAALCAWPGTVAAVARVSAGAPAVPPVTAAATVAMPLAGIAAAGRAGPSAIARPAIAGQRRVPPQALPAGPARRPPRHRAWLVGSVALVVALVAGGLSVVLAFA